MPCPYLAAAPPPPTPANDDATPYCPIVGAVDAIAEKEPEPDHCNALPAPARAELVRLPAADDWPGLAALGATGVLRSLGPETADLASPEALGRALFRPAGRLSAASGDLTASTRPVLWPTIASD